MKTALIIGASGSFGGSIAQELSNHGWRVRALQREGGHRIDRDRYEVVTGSALDYQRVLDAARDAELIVHGYNVPYPRWRRLLLPAADVVARVAEATSATVLFPGNVYGLPRDSARPMSEDIERNAPSRKGALRNAVEERLRQATRSGARVLVVRTGDFMGNAGHTNWFDLMTRGLERSGRIVEPSPGNVPHEWAYLPDLVRAARLLLETGAQKSAYEEFHFSSYQVTGEELRRVIAEVWGKPSKVRRFPWPLVTLLSPLVPMLRELLEMRYLWTEPVLLDDAKLVAALPNFEKTPIKEAVTQCLGQQLEQRAAQDPAAQARAAA